jgi:putative oxidoreductase
LTIGGYAPKLVIADIAFTVLRVFTGASMAIAHGWGKFSSSAARDGMAPMLESLGLPGSGSLWAWMAAIGEFIAGLLLAAGLLTRLASFLMLATMLVAGVWVHLIHNGDPYTRAEHALLFAAIAFAFLLAGSGKISLDALIRR